MALSELKNESLFHARMSEEDARDIALYAQRKGWIKAPEPSKTQVLAPKNKKALSQPTLNCEEFRTPKAYDGPRSRISACVGMRP